MLSEFDTSPLDEMPSRAVLQWLAKDLAWLVTALNDTFPVDADGNVTIPAQEFSRVDEVVCYVTDFFATHEPAQSDEG